MVEIDGEFIAELDRLYEERRERQAQERRSAAECRAMAASFRREVELWRGAKPPNGGLTSAEFWAVTRAMVAAEFLARARMAEWEQLARQAERDERLAAGVAS